uniref:Uncharacterized protein n=1 Tax=Chromera velia CCMP2878 TaxID=1169474 RepID=A0A0G4FBZ5_9ALVE|eukprot:Cvel_16109.t1-p1 / transcript=Cvel_16109.t1 / gene=Cvel_16109 / organism=Chromera_velia_CCMP2878 / gene_product=hypothetical protein / transcript_product=hypothetical protein / location=Cvel_scaffold1226:8700-13049(+) / protein_length=792 / sequence_SO=supercontig / SO=protein_coding / is_pseudo=false
MTTPASGLESPLLSFASHPDGEEEHGEHDHEADDKKTRRQKVRVALRRLFSTPEYIGDRKHLEESWLDVFYDLFFVIAATNCTDIFLESATKMDFFRFATCWFVFYQQWMTFTLYKARVKSEGLLYDLMFLFHMIGLFGMVLECGEEENAPRFGVNIILAKVAMALLQLKAGLMVPRLRVWGVFYCFNNLLGCVVVAVGIILHVTKTDGFTICLAASVALEHVLSTTGHFHFRKRTIDDVLPNVGLTARRLGMLTMVLLGESFISMATENRESSEDPEETRKRGFEFYVSFTLAAIAVWSLHILFYHFDVPKDEHALRSPSLLKRYAFIQSYGVLGLCLLMLGACWRFLIQMNGLLRKPKNPSEAEWEQEAAEEVVWLTFFVYTSTLILMGLLRILHYIPFGRNDRIRSAVRTASRRVTGGDTFMTIWKISGFLYVFPAYFAPLMIPDNSRTAVIVLLVVCCHALTLVLADSAMAHWFRIRVETAKEKGRRNSSDSLPETNGCGGEEERDGEMWNVVEGAQGHGKRVMNGGPVGTTGVMLTESASGTGDGEGVRLAGTGRVSLPAGSSGGDLGAACPYCEDKKARVRGKLGEIVLSLSPSQSLLNSACSLGTGAEAEGGRRRSYLRMAPGLQRGSPSASAYRLSGCVSVQEAETERESPPLRIGVTPSIYLQSGGGGGGGGSVGRGETARSYETERASEEKERAETQEVSPLSLHESGGGEGERSHQVTESSGNFRRQEDDINPQPPTAAAVAATTAGALSPPPLSAAERTRGASGSQGDILETGENFQGTS